MRYFNSLPNIINIGNNGESNVLKNLFVRTSIKSELKNIPLVFYKYSIQDGDTPEIIADKYYGDSYRYWMVLYGNSNILDPQRDWPLTTQQLTDYLKNKYSTVAGGDNLVPAYLQSNIHHYEKIITTIDSVTNNKAIKTIEIDETTYNNLDEINETKYFNDQSFVSISVTKKIVSLYEYEINLNESKREIDIINSKYASQLETQYQKLVNI